MVSLLSVRENQLLTLPMFCQAAVLSRRSLPKEVQSYLFTFVKWRITMKNIMRIEGKTSSDVSTTYWCARPKIYHLEHRLQLWNMILWETYHSNNYCSRQHANRLSWLNIGQSKYFKTLSRLTQPTGIK